MEKTENKGGLKLIIGILVLAAIIVGLIIALSSCGGDDGQQTAKEPDVKDTVEDTLPADDGDEPSATGGSVNGGASSGGTNAGSGENGGDAAAPNGGASLEEWVAYLKNYDDNVENGVEGATDDFTDMIDQVGDSMSNGNYGDGFEQFGSGVKDYVGGLIGSLTP